MKNRYLGWVSLSVFLSWIGLGFLTCGNSNKSSTPEDVIQGNASLLYEISGNGLTKPSYVFGTIHMIAKKDFFFPKKFEKTFKKSEKLVMEIDLTDIMGQMGLLSMAQMPDGRSVKELYADEEWQTMNKIARDSLGIELGMFASMKPIFIQQNLLLGNIFGEDIKSYELHFMELANTHKIPMGGLESAGEQMRILDSISLEDQAVMLKESIYEFHTAKKSLLELVHFYKLQNIDSLYAHSMKDGGLKDSEASLLTNRNTKWIPLMEADMKQQSTFFAVGAAHLGGPNGVLKLLQEKGYTVKPL